MHGIDYDASQGGRVFADPEGDAVRYQVRLGPTAHGLRVEGTRIVGAPESLQAINVVVLGFDSAGLSASDEFVINVSVNAAPRVTATHADVLVKAGEPVSLDAKLGADQFADPEGDALRYEVNVRGTYGLAVNGTRVEGRLNTVGAAEVSVTATDPFGASVSDVFLIAVPAPLPKKSPVLPASAFEYELSASDLPAVYGDRQAIFDTARAENPVTNAGATLGRVLFHDKRLSITNTVSCSTCHQQAHGFASNRRFDTGVSGVPLTQQAMPLANVRFNKSHAWFSDMRAGTLRDAARMALQDPREMGMFTTLLEEKLRATSFYPPLFAAAFGTPAIDEERVAAALEQYLRSLVSWRSRLDRVSASGGFNAQEKRGQEIFQGAAGVPCSRCHDVQTGSNRWPTNNGIGSTGAFRAAALKNIALTAPYMHDGRFATLREVIDHYDHGIRDSTTLDAALRDADGRPRRMNLSEADKQALEAFLRTFTDEAMVADPKFSDPFR